MIKALDVGHPKIAELKVKRTTQYFLVSSELKL